MTPFRKYADSLDHLYAISEPKTWIPAYVVWIFLIALGAWIPVTSQYIQLRPGPVLLALGCQSITVLLMPLVHRRLSPYFATVFIILTDPLVELIMMMMVVLSANLLGKIIYGLLLVVALLGHGWNNRVAWTQPYQALGVTLLMPLAVLMDPRPENLVLLGILMLGGLFLMITVGTAAEVQFRNQQRTAAERAAVAAQMLEQANSEAAGWERQFTLLAGLHHDVGNLLTTATLKSGLMVRKLQTGQPLVESAEVMQSFGTINEALTTVSGLIAEAKKSAPSQPTERVDFVPVLKSVAESVRSSPTLSLSLELPSSAAVDVPGGESTLKRLFDNLLRNAVEGDGKRQGRNIRVELVDTGAALTVSISDDGPGFPEHLLAGRAKGYFTTKAQGTGLGLVTAEALTAACRGTLRRSNRHEGGARVDVVLPRAKEAEAPREEVA